MEYEDIKHKLPKNFVNKPNTIILIDDKGEPIYQQNDDGTVSGFPIERLASENNLMAFELSKINPSNEFYLVDGDKLFSIREDERISGVGISKLPPNWLSWAQSNCNQIDVNIVLKKKQEIINKLNGL